MPLVPEVVLEPMLEPEEPVPLAPIEDEEPVEPEALGLLVLEDEPLEPEALGLLELEDELLGLVELEPEALGLEPEALLGLLLELPLVPEAPIELLPPLVEPLALGVVEPLLPVLEVSAAVLGALVLPLAPVEPELDPVLEPVPAPTPVPIVPPAPPPLPLPPDCATA